MFQIEMMSLWRAWMPCVGCMLVQMTIFGIHNNFGLVYHHLMLEFRESRADTGKITFFQIQLIQFFYMIFSRLVILIFAKNLANVLKFFFAILRKELKSVWLMQSKFGHDHHNNEWNVFGKFYENPTFWGPFCSKCPKINYNLSLCFQSKKFTKCWKNHIDPPITDDISSHISIPLLWDGISATIIQFYRLSEFNEILRFVTFLSLLTVNKTMLGVGYIKS